MAEEVGNCSTELLSTSKCANLPLHNIKYTKEVVSDVNIISDYIILTEKEREPILISPRFHDTCHAEI